MGKRKLTFGVSEDLIKEAKLYARETGRSLSEIVEEYFEYLVSTKWINTLAEEFELEGLESTAEHEIPMLRPAGLDVAKIVIVRELRRSRAGNLLHGAE